MFSLFYPIFRRVSICVCLYGFASIAIVVVCGRCVLHRLCSTTVKHPCLKLCAHTLKASLLCSLLPLPPTLSLRQSLPIPYYPSRCTGNPKIAFSDLIFREGQVPSPTNYETVLPSLPIPHYPSPRTPKIKNSPHQPVT